MGLPVSNHPPKMELLTFLQNLRCCLFHLAAVAAAPPETPPLLPIIACLSTSLALTVIVSFEMPLILSAFPDQPSSRKQV